MKITVHPFTNIAFNNDFESGKGVFTQEAHTVLPSGSKLGRVFHDNKKSVSHYISAVKSQIIKREKELGRYVVNIWYHVGIDPKYRRDCDKITVVIDVTE